MTANEARAALSDGHEIAESGAPPVASGHATWPHQLSHEPSLRVSDVLQIIGNEFPALTPSKLRFFDRLGLVSPSRTAAGYRQYSAADIERLRFVLREQRDHYRPLSVIQHALAQLDTGHLRQAITPREVEKETADYVSESSLAALAGVDVALVEDMAQERLIVETIPGGFDRHLAPVVTAVAQYVAAGGDLRAARVVRNAAVREVDLARATAATSLGKSDPGAASAMIGDRAHAAAGLFTAFAIHDSRA